MNDRIGRRPELEVRKKDGSSRAREIGVLRKDLSGQSRVIEALKKDGTSGSHGIVAQERDVAIRDRGIVALKKDGYDLGHEIKAVEEKAVEAITGNLDARGRATGDGDVDEVIAVDMGTFKKEPWSP